MATFTLSRDGTTWPRPGFGAMGLSAYYGKTNFEEGQETLRAAIKEGCTVWNTADMYAKGGNEELVGSVLKEGNNRSKIFLITKFGNKWGPGIEYFEVYGSKEYAAKAIDASIQRLGCTPDAWIVHRIDKKVPIEETVTAMEAARKEGKTKYIGLSECSATTLKRASKVAKIDFIEIEYSPWTLVMEENGVLATAKELGITVLAYSPLGRGFLTGRYKTAEDFAKDGDFRAMLPRMQKDNFEHNYKLVQKFEEIAKKKGCTPGQLSLAWLMAQGDNIVPIPGTKSEKYLIENVRSRDIELSADDVKEIRDAAVEFAPKGTRYAASMMKSLDE